jgi:hypothetical protein
MMSATKLTQARIAKYNIILHVETSKESRKNPVWTCVAPVYYTLTHTLKDFIIDPATIVKNDSKELLHMTLESVLKYKSFGFRLLNIYLVQSNLGGERIKNLNNCNFEDNPNQIWDLVSKDSSPIFIVKNYRNGKLMLKESMLESIKFSSTYSWRSFSKNGKRGERSPSAHLQSLSNELPDRRKTKWLVTENYLYYSGLMVLDPLTRNRIVYSTNVYLKNSKRSTLTSQNVKSQKSKATISFAIVVCSFRR